MTDPVGDIVPELLPVPESLPVALALAPVESVGVGVCDRLALALSDGDTVGDALATEDAERAGEPD